jgi:hypothetical protein
MGDLTLQMTAPAGVRQQFDELAAAYPGLALSQDPSGLWIIEGPLAFKATFDGATIEDIFNIRLRFLPDPTTPPMVDEIGGRIPKDYHKLGDDSLCLGTPVEVRTKFRNDSRLLAFVEDQVIPYLFSFCFRQKYGKMPYGERPHGGKGLLESYHEVFKVEDRSAVLHLLKILAMNSYRGHLPCACGANIKLKKCHGPELIEMRSLRPAKHFLADIGLIIRDLPKEEVKAIGSEILSPDLWKALKVAMLGREGAKKHA